MCPDTINEKLDVWISILEGIKSDTSHIRTICASLKEESISNDSFISEMRELTLRLKEDNKRLDEIYQRLCDKKRIREILDKRKDVSELL